MKSRSRDEVRTVAENLGTYPGLNNPIVPVEAGADVLRDNPPTGYATLTPHWSPKPITVPLPLRLWNCRCLILNGFADAARMNAELKPRKVQPVNDKLLPDEQSSKTLVALYGSDYVGTSLGPFKAVFTLVWVKSTQETAGPYFMW